MNKTEAINRLRRHADAIKAMGATSLYLFGSVAHDADSRDSDLDLFVDHDRNSRFNAFDLVASSNFLNTN
jgi:predicted nucleotidyltransferase